MHYLSMCKKNVSWRWGFAVLAFGVGRALLLLLCGLPKYCYQPPVGSPLTKIAQVCTAALLNSNKALPAHPSMLYDVNIKGKKCSSHQHIEVHPLILMFFSAS